MIFFDIDDTLLDYKASQDTAALEFAKRHTAHIQNPENFPARWDEVTKRHMARYLSRELSFQEQRRCRICDVLGLDLTPQEADKIFDEYYEIYEESWRLFPEVESVLNKLTDYALGVITNGDRDHQISKLDKLGILTHFTEIVTPACAGAAKPDVAIFRHAASRSGKLASECWYVGDSYSTDYEGALSAGYRSVWLNRSGMQLQCDYQCKDLNEFLLAVQQE